MKRLLIGCLCLFFINVLAAQDTLKPVAKSNINVEDNMGVFGLMERHKLLNERNVFITGFRIQIAFTNNKDEAMKNKTLFYQSFPDMRCYITYEQPYHKIRVGDYQNLNETKADLQAILQVFPGSFVVQDKVRRKKISTE